MFTTTGVLPSFFKKQTRTYLCVHLQLCGSVCAAVLSSVGLGTNSAPIIVASMLVSPLMGPIMAMSLALNLRHFKLAWLGARNFSISMLIAIIIGFIAGLVGLPWVSGPSVWPTYEMSSRGGEKTLLVGIVIALFSGAGVALSILSDNSSSLVGVAISAALMPPAVNTGMSWAVAVGHKSIKCAHSPTLCKQDHAHGFFC
jgi:uncharacterized hydrophobic protein (TIGR00271 family)